MRDLDEELLDFCFLLLVLWLLVDLGTEELDDELPADLSVDPFLGLADFL